MTTPLSQFRDLTCLLFRVVDPQARFEDVDRLVHKLHDVLSEGASTPRPAFFEPVFMQELMRPPTPPTLVIHPDQKATPIPPADVQRSEPEPSTVRNVVVNLPPTTVHAVKLGSEDASILKDLKRDEDSVATPDYDDEEEASDSEKDDVTVDSEDEGGTDETDGETEDEASVEEETEEEQEDEEDEDIELLKIKKDKYYWSPTSKRVYEYLEEGYGDCIGTYVDGKIKPK